MNIDVHAHMVPASLAGRLAGGGAGHAVTSRVESGRLHLTVGERPELRVRDDLVDVAARVAAMDRAGLDVQLLSAWIPLTAYHLPSPEGAAWSRLFNESLADTVSTHPDRFRAMATVPLQDGVAAAGELSYAVRELNMVGVQIAPNVNGGGLEEGLDEFWEAAERLRCVVLIHPDQESGIQPKPPFMLSNFVGNAAETTVAASRLVLGGVLERHPDLKICLVHGGGYVPTQAPRLDHGYEHEPRLADRRIDRPPSHYLRQMYYDTVTHSPEVLRYLVDFAGHEQVLLGTDYPFEMGETDPVGLLQRVSGLTDSQRADMRGGTLARLLGEVRHLEES